MLITAPVISSSYIFTFKVWILWMLITMSIISSINYLFFLQTSLQLSWMLFGGNHHTLLGEQMNISQEMTSWLKVNKHTQNILIKMNCYIWSPRYVWNCRCGPTRGSNFGHPLCTMEQTRGIPSPLLQYPSTHTSTQLMFLSLKSLACAQIKQISKATQSQSQVNSVRFGKRIWTVDLMQGDRDLSIYFWDFRFRIRLTNDVQKVCSFSQ